ncbi:MAG TPA: DUF5682 family protein [Blastocatellia bacterium]|nr:DUF5682 family protein [Blastocatellia bacterium]
MVEGLISGDEAKERLTSLLDRLWSDEVVYFPIRHHSPACAWHVDQAIRRLRPGSILIEGPASFTGFVPLILHPRSAAPFALYTHFVDKERRIGFAASSEKGDPGPARFAAYYPFCDYSPELVALRTGSEIGAELRFIDLDYPDQILTERLDTEAPLTPRVETLMRDRHLQQSAYLKALAARSGCRDHNELWDHLFECSFQSVATEDFVKSIAAYCFMSRANSPEDELRADGTLAREAMMASQIAREISSTSRSRGPVLVVTGGFHTVVLPDLVGLNPAEPERLAASEGSTQQALIRYSFEQLDSLNGYAAGMPSPHFYHRLWHSLDEGEAPAYEHLAAELVVEIGRLTREKNLQSALSTADEIAALQQAQLLARMRGHTGPTREDLLDGIRGAFVKGSMEAEGSVILGIAEHVFCGTGIGNIPDEAGVPPIVADFRTRALSLRLNNNDSIRKKLSLDIYRKEGHRQVSRLLHCLRFLEVPFANVTRGPDFVRGSGLHLIHERWEYSWMPATEAGLVRVAVYGSTVEEASVNRLKESIYKLEEQGAGRSAVAAASILVSACRMGLHRHTEDIIAMIAAGLAEEPLFASVVQAAKQLVLLWQSREPLEAQNLAAVPELIRSGYIRTCYLIAGLAACAPEEQDRSLEGLAATREILIAGRGELLDAELLWEAGHTLLADPDCDPVICGGMAGILRSEGQLPDDQLARLVAGRLGAAVQDWPKKVGFLRGLLYTCREAAWQDRALIEAANVLIGGWDETEFVSALPEMRLAFAKLTPRETDKVARVVAGLFSVENLGSLVHHDISEGELRWNLLASELVNRSLEEDGLAGWLRIG